MKFRSVILMISLVLSSLILIVPSEDVEGAVITVSTDGTKMYTSIQDAIDAANEGDEILIYSGTYDESIIINKTGITIRGQSRTNTRIDPDGPDFRIHNGIRVESSWVNISSINITGANTGLVGIGVMELNISNMEFYNNSGSCIIIEETSNFTIMDSTLDKPYDHEIQVDIPTILLKGARNGFISNNTIKTPVYADGLELKDSNHITFIDNEMEGSGLIISSTDLDSWNTQTIPSSNTLNGYQVIYIKDSITSTFTGVAGQVIIANSTSVTLMGQSINNTRHPIRVAHSVMITMSNIHLTDCEKGIFLLNTTSSTIADSIFHGLPSESIGLIRSDWNWIFNCTITNGISGIKLLGSNNCTIMDTSMYMLDFVHNQLEGIYLLPDGSGIPSNDNLIQSCDLTGNSRGIKIMDSSRNKILTTSIKDAAYGVEITSGGSQPRSSSNTIEECVIAGSEISGIYLYYANDTMISDCYINTSVIGIYCRYSEQLNIESCFARDNHDMFLKINNSEGISLEGTSLYSNRVYFGSSRSKNIDIHSNLIRYGNDIFSVGSSENILFYDNDIESTSFGQFNDEIKWNISKTPGTNIIGGPYLGGNYWSDYNGLDLDGDGIGDTLVPHGPGDLLPLQYDLVPPSITDVTVGDPTTGDIFEIRARPEDERLEVYPTLEYWYGNSGVHKNVSMIICNPWGYDLLIPEHSTETLHYICSTEDGNGNWNSTSVISRGVRDNDPPMIINNYSGPLSVPIGENINVSFTGSDNIEMKEIKMYYIDVHGNEYNTSLDPLYSQDHFITGQNRTGSLQFWFEIVDSSGNWNESDMITLIIIDINPPEIEIINPRDSHRFWLVGGYQNIILEVTDKERYISYVDAYLIGDTTRNGTFSILQLFNISKPGASINWSWDTAIHEDGPYLLIINASDPSGNIISKKIKLTLDNTKPIVNAGEDQIIQIGEEVELDIGVAVDDHLDSFKWTFLYGGKEQVLIGYSTVFTFHLAGTYFVTLNVTDLAGNWNTDVLVITVIPQREQPRIISSSIENGRDNVNITDVLTIYFSTGMDRSSVALGLSMVPIESYSLNWINDDTILEISFPDGLSEGTNYTIMISSARDKNLSLLDPATYVLVFTTGILLHGEINIISPEDGQKIEKESMIIVSGVVNEIDPGTEIMANIDGRTYTSNVKNSGSFEIQVITPKETGTYTLKVLTENTESSIDIQVVDRKVEDQDNFFIYIGLFLIIVALILATFIWIRSSKKSKGLSEE